MEEVENLKEKLLENKAALRISRIPKGKLDVFRELAEKEFCNDYGWCLTALLDSYLTEKDLNERLLRVEQKVELLQMGSEEEKPKTIKLLNGTTLEPKE